MLDVLRITLYGVAWVLAWLLASVVAVFLGVGLNAWIDTVETQILRILLTVAGIAVTIVVFLTVVTVCGKGLVRLLDRAFGGGE